MILSITTTHTPATDLGFLLHKHPDKLQSIALALGQAHIFYPIAEESECTICLALDINPLDLVRNKKGSRAFFLQQHYVNDRTYTANSFLSTAIVKAFGSAINGTCQTMPELVETPIPLKATISSLKIDTDFSYLEKLFTPLGYTISYEILPLDDQFPSWGESKYVNLTIENTIKLKDLLSQIYLFILVLDNERHYWVGQSEVEVLVRRGGDWLEKHPLKEWITRRYLRNVKTYMNEALLKLAGEEISKTETFLTEKKISLHQKRLNRAAELLKESGAQSVLDMGCGEGKLLKLLLKESQFTKIAGMDVAFGELQKAKENLYLNEASPALRERISLFQGSVTYKDERTKGFDAVALVEVIEHLDLERLSAMEKVVFGYTNPATVVLSTPNSEYNVLFETLEAENFRHDDHRFEWTRKEFSDWCAKVCETYHYNVVIYAVGDEMKNVGAPSQMAVFSTKI